MPSRSYPSSRPAYQPYAPQTMPYYLDLFWAHFKGRPFAISGVDGYTANQVDTTGVAITLKNAAAQGATSITLQSGQGAYFVAGEPIVIGDGGVNWQSVTIGAGGVSGDTITFFPKILPVGGWPANTTFVNHAWGNAEHPAYNAAWNAWGAAIANAKMRKCNVRPTIMPPNGAGNGNDLGSMEDPYTDANGVTQMPKGWQSLNAGANVSCLTTTYGTTTFSPNARTHDGLAITTTAVGAGIATIVPIPVKPGTDYTLSFNAKVASGTLGIAINVVDFTTTTIQLATYNRYNFADENYQNLSARTTLQFTVPGGTTSLAIQFVGQDAFSAQTFFDDLRLVESRESPLYDRYVIEADPEKRPIVMLGDSWTVGQTQSGYSGFKSAIQARLPGTTVINAGITGQTVDQMVARMVTPTTPGVQAVIPNLPKYCVLGTGMQNDLNTNYSQSQQQTNLANFIDICRQNGIVPVIPGLAPSSNSNITGGLQTCHDINDALRAQCALVTQ